MDRRALPLAVLVAAAAGVLARPLGTGPLRLELGGFANGLTSGAWERADRADLDPQATSDGVTSFYFRPSPPNAALHLPVVAPGATRLTLRASASVRSGVSVFRNGVRVDELLVLPRQWSRYALELPADARGQLELALALRPLPLVKGDHVDAPRLLLDFLELESPSGLRASWRACLRVALVPLLAFGFGLAVSLGPRAALAGALAAGVAATLLARAAPFATYLAIPRLLPLALAAGYLAFAALRRARAATDAQAGPLAALVALGTLLHGSLVFFPDHNPPDIDIHVRRTLDLAGVPLDYQALLRYGSQLPTASQDQGAATAALGERTLIPYSPLPYFFYYAFHAAGARPLLGDDRAERRARDAGGSRAVCGRARDLGLRHRLAGGAALRSRPGRVAPRRALARAGRVRERARGRGAAAAGGAGGRARSADARRRSSARRWAWRPSATPATSCCSGLLGLVLLALLLVDAAGLTHGRRAAAWRWRWSLGGLLAGALVLLPLRAGAACGARAA